MDYSDMENVYQKYSRVVYGFLYSHTHNAEWSEEMTQETFLKASMSISRVELTDDLPDASISDGETLLFCRKIR